MSTIKPTNSTANTSPASASSNLLQAPPPTRVNSPPPASASGASDLNDIDLSAGPPLSLDTLQTSNQLMGDPEVDPKESDSDDPKRKSPESLPRMPSSESPSPSLRLSLNTTELTTPGHIPSSSSSSSIPLVVVSPPESNHGSPIVSPYISPSNSSTHSGSGSAGGAGASAAVRLGCSGQAGAGSETSLAFEAVDRDDDDNLELEGTSSPSLTGSASSPEHLSEDWHPRATEAHDHNDHEAIAKSKEDHKTDQDASGASSNPNNTLAPKNSNAQAHTSVASSSSSQTPSSPSSGSASAPTSAPASKQTRQERKALGSPLFRRLMNLLNVHSAGYQDSGASSSK